MRESKRENDNGKERIRLFVSIVSSFLPLPLIMGLFVALWFLFMCWKTNPPSSHPTASETLQSQRGLYLNKVSSFVFNYWDLISCDVIKYILIFRPTACILLYSFISLVSLLWFFLYLFFVSIIDWLS